MRVAGRGASDGDGDALAAFPRGYGEAPHSMFAWQRALARGTATATLPPGIRTVATRGHVCATTAAVGAKKLVAILEAIITANDK